MLPWILFMLAAFLSGSVPFGVLLARARGIDIRAHGSRNIGATNVARVLGPRLGLLCLALDLFKGLIPVLGAGLAMGLVPRSFVPAPIPPEQSILWLLTAALAILGHMFPPWLGFRGGKGVATGLGAMLGVFPYLTIPALGALVLWMLILARWRYVGLASSIAALALPLLVWAWSAAAPDGARLLPFTIATALLAALVIWKHRGNLRRTLQGAESRLGAR